MNKLAIVKQGSDRNIVSSIEIVLFKNERV